MLTLCYNPKASENFLMFLLVTKKEHWPNMGQHGIILLHLRNNKYDMKRKTSKYFKRPNYFMMDCHTPEESSQSICREHRSVGPCIVRTSIMK